MSKKEIIQLTVIILLSLLLGNTLRFIIKTKKTVNAISETVTTEIAKTDLKKDLNNLAKDVTESVNSINSNQIPPELDTEETISIDFTANQSLIVPFKPQTNATIKNIRSSAKLNNGSILNLSILDLLDQNMLAQNQIVFLSTVDLNQLYRNFDLVDNQISFTISYNENEIVQKIIVNIIKANSAVINESLTNPFINSTINSDPVDPANLNQPLINPFTGTNESTPAPRKRPTASPSLENTANPLPSEPVTEL